MYLNKELFTDFLNVKEILWTGINFAKAHFTRKGFDFTQEVLQRYFQEWNTLIINDQKKYDIRMSFRKPMMAYNLALVTKTNKGLKASHMIKHYIDIKDVLSDDQVCEYMATLDLPDTHRYALMFLVESFDDATKMASVWVVIARTADGKVALCEKFLKTPGGFGTRNYWARAFYNLLYDVKTYAFLRWENMVQRQDDEPAVEEPLQ